MDSNEVDALVKEAEEKSEEDKARKSAVEARNLADSTVHQSEKTLVDNADKVKEEDKKEAEEAIAELKKVLENVAATKDELEPATKKVNDIMMKVGQAIYAQPGAEAGAEAKPDDGVVDAEEDKGDDKKNERV
jgi:molecular chaperone DnaK